jgi:cell division protein FtsI (penicillin-binding protein 3)
MTELAPPVSKQASKSDWRLILLMACFCLCYVAVGLKMGTMASTDPAEPRSSRSDPANRPVRAEIVDREGRLLAANLPAWSLYAHPHEIKDPVAVADMLDPIFPEIDRETLLRKLSGKSRFVWIKRPVTPRERQLVHDLGQPGLFFGNREIRVYPAGPAMAHIVGGVTPKAEGVHFAELVGSGGVEQHFDARLRDPASAAEPLRLSLDLSVQQAVRAELVAGMKAFHAKGAAGVLMNARTGEIVSLVSLPDFDPNVRPQVHAGDPAFHPRFNRAAQGRYELGSTFKVLTAAMALEERIVNANTTIQTPRKLRYGRHTIGDSHRMDPEMTFEDVIVESSNVGTARVAMMLGTRRFRDYLSRLGMFEPSGLELTEAAEAKTLLPGRWTDLSTMTISFGHGLAASPVHLAAAYATIANGGVRVHPTLVAGQSRAGERVFSEAVSREMLRIMREVVVRGTARRGDVPGYLVGGKTGTAEKVINGAYSRKKVIATFAAVFPVNNPKYVLIVSLDEAEDRSGRTPSRSAGRTAVPVAAGIVRRIAPLLGMRPLRPGNGGTMAAVNVNSE